MVWECSTFSRYCRNVSRGELKALYDSPNRPLWKSYFVRLGSNESLLYHTFLDDTFCPNIRTNVEGLLIIIEKRHSIVLISI